MKYLSLSLVLIAALLLNSCNNDVLFAENHIFENHEWATGDTVDFQVNISDTLSSHNFILNIRNHIDYSFSNLYLFVQTQLPNHQFGQDTIQILLAEKDGKWIGKGYGDLKENQIIIRNNMKFKDSGIYSFKFIQAMRKDTLEGIESIGIRIESEK